MSSSPLIGRDDELAELEARARSHRLVTVVGPGGVGKTALARVVAERLEHLHALGTRTVDLTRVDDPDVLPGTIAVQLGFESFDALLSSPNDRPVLLLVDNCEHLLDAAADVIVQVLGSCRQPTVLATSRSPLEVPGESIVSLAPLAVPAGDDDPATCASVRLFLERCRDAGTAVDGSDLPAVVDLCRRLDGLPLAIEIAAARTRTLGVAEIAARLSDAVDVLDRPRFRGDPRHRSVAETIRWSHDLLAPGPAELLGQLAVFAGPFTVADAASIVSADRAPSLDADLDDLVAASLVVADTDGRAARYRLLVTVRRFALGELRRRDELDAAYDRFVDHVVARVQQTVAGTATTWRPSIVRELVAAFDDIAEAVRWCIGHDESPRRASRLCSVLWAVLHQGHADDIAELARRTMARWPDDGSHRAAQVTAVLATAEYVTGHPRRALELAAASLAGGPEPRAATVTLHRVLGQARRAVDDTAGAVEAFRVGAALGHELGMVAMALELETAAALVTADEGDVAAAVHELRGVVERASAGESAIVACWATTALGWVMLRLDQTEARPVIEAALAEARAIDYPIGVAAGLRSRAYAELLAGDSGAAVGTATDLLHDLIGRGALSNGRLLLDVTGVIAHRCGHPSWGQLIATARALPTTSLVSSIAELVELPPTDATPVGRHDAIGVASRVLAELAADLPAPGDDADPAVGVPAPAAAAGGSIRRLGDVRELTYAGVTVSVRAGKGLEDVIRLIEADGREVHCLDLAGAGVEERSTGDVIDVEARRSYEQKIRELQAEVEEAQEHSDYARAYRHQAELDALIEHLTAALGHGGRTRRATDTAERARSAVTHRIRSAIRQLEKRHPRLGLHLSNSISTGTYCSYRPERPTTWRID